MYITGFTICSAETSITITGVGVHSVDTRAVYTRIGSTVIYILSIQKKYMASSSWHKKLDIEMA